MAKVKGVHDMFYFVDDVMRILGYEKSKAYKIMAQLNAELEENGIYVDPESRKFCKALGVAGY